MRLGHRNHRQHLNVLAERREKPVLYSLQPPKPSGRHQRMEHRLPPSDRMTFLRKRVVHADRLDRTASLLNHTNHSVYRLRRNIIRMATVFFDTPTSPAKSLSLSNS